MKIKHTNKDFFVREILDIDSFLEEEGEFYYFLLRKEGWNTIDALRKISDLTNTSLKNIGFAGNKDRNAMTEQYISIRSFKDMSNTITSLKISDARLTYIGKGQRPISLGDLEGNFFDITIRELKTRHKPINKFANYFGSQRFGFEQNNIEIGRALLKRNFKLACELLNLDTRYGDYIASLTKLDKRELKFYVSSFQSYLWNKVNRPIDIIGFDYEGDEYDSLLAKEGLTKKDFIFKEIPYLSAESSKREYEINVDIETVDYSKDELFPGFYRQEICFFLPKSAYATVVIEQMFLGE